MAKLLTITNAKTVKGQKKGYLTGILYMMPDTDICPASKIAGCAAGCLVSAGRGAFGNVKSARTRKTEFYRNDKQGFYEQLRKDCLALIKTAEKKGLIPVVRLNGTSDIDHTDFIASMPELQFYDYTKMVGIAQKAKGLANYHVTFSYSGTTRYKKHVTAAIESGFNMAVIFRNKTLPKFFMGLPVINGDETDLRFLDQSQVVVGLYAKGKMKKDNSGMVVDICEDAIAIG